MRETYKNLTVSSLDYFRNMHGKKFCVAVKKLKLGEFGESLPQI